MTCTSLPLAASKTRMSVSLPPAATATRSPFGLMVTDCAGSIKVIVAAGLSSGLVPGGAGVRERLAHLPVQAVDAGPVVRPADDQPRPVRGEGDAAQLGGRRDAAGGLAVGQRPHGDDFVRPAGRDLRPVLAQRQAGGG